MSRFVPVYSGTRQVGTGIFISWTGNRISISARLEVSGAEATQQRTDLVEECIERIWTNNFDMGYSVRCTVDMLLRTSATEQPDRSQIYITNDTTPTHVSIPVRNPILSVMHIHLRDTFFEWTPAHEFGHMLGLGDHYSESWLSSTCSMGITNEYIRPIICGSDFHRTAETDVGWETNIMGATNGILERRNLQDLQALYMMREITVAEDIVSTFEESYTGMEMRIERLYPIR